MAAIAPSCVFLLIIAIIRVEGVCVDKIPNCDQYAMSTCKKYTNWAIKNCPKKCGLCDSNNNGGRCPPHWSYSQKDQTCFHIFGMFRPTSRKTWADARSLCRAVGANLMTIKNKSKNDFIRTFLSNTYYWIGIKNVETTGNTMVFKYVDGTKLTPYSFKNWGYQQPDNYQNKEHCVVMSKNGQWSDINCQEKQAFICQRDAYEN